LYLVRDVADAPDRNRARRWSVRPPVQCRAGTVPRPECRLPLRAAGYAPTHGPHHLGDREVPGERAPSRRLARHPARAWPSMPHPGL